jgi:two-component system nitrate/nitrite response regulator NarL
VSFPAASLRVVIVEDHALLRELLMAYIRNVAGHVVVAECATIAESLVACREHHPDLVLLEWTLPDGTGEQLLKPLVPELPATRWLVLCARQNGQIVQSALAHGAHGFLMKQSDVAALREAIDRLGQGGTYYCPLSSNVLLEALRTRARPNGDGLTERELEVLRHFATGTNPKAIAEQLKVSTKTVQNQLSAIRQKLGIQETAGLVRYAIRIGLDD